ncbi:MAG: hypothetical protein IH987_14145, partial [Planctomycetes bacterium]|nr:hypothetical protein [Planctomycetota bacterium]
MSGVLVFGLAALGLRPPAVPGGEFANLTLVAERAAPSATESVQAIGREAATMTRVPTLRQPREKDVLSRGKRHAIDAKKATPVDRGRGAHVGRVVGSTPVATNRGAGASRAAGGLPLAAECSCDEDCDASFGDQCNIVQCIVRGVCSDDPTVPCSTAQAGGSADADCEAVGAGTCQSNSFVQRCDVVQLTGWTCEFGNGFCIEDRCEDDGTGNEHSVCIPQISGQAVLPLSPCPSQCVGGAANGLRCDRSSQCPQGDCLITSGGLCDDATEACYVGPSVALALGRCCIGDTCTETDEATCTSGSGEWYRYRGPDEQVGDGNCLCPKYGSGVVPPGTDEGSIGLVRPSGLVCTAGSAAADVAGLDPVYCEDLDGDGFAPQFCLRRCVGGDNEGALCEVDSPDCGRLGTCNGAGSFVICFVPNNGADCGVCSISGNSCDVFGFFACPQGETCEFPGGQTCVPANLGSCEDDPCASNTIEGGCEDGFLNIGDDYAIANGSFLRLSRIRFRGGVSRQGEDIVLEFWDSTGTHLVDSIEVNDLDQIGTRDWTIEVDCWPNCNPAELEAPAAIPVIIPPNGYLVMRSVRTIGTLNGAAAFWSQTDAEDVGANDAGKSWINGDPNGDGKGLETHTLQIPAVTALQEAYVRKVIDTVNDLDNVLYEITNESGAYSTEWQYHMINYIKNYEANNKPKRHPVGMTFQFKGGNNSTLFNSPADWISPNASGGYRDNPPAADGSKVIISDTDHICGVCESDRLNYTWAWKSFLRGLNPIYMDPYSNPRFSADESVPRAMGHTR